MFEAWYTNIRCVSCSIVHALYASDPLQAMCQKVPQTFGLVNERFYETLEPLDSST